MVSVGTGTGLLLLGGNLLANVSLGVERESEGGDTDSSLPTPAHTKITLHFSSLFSAIRVETLTDFDHAIS